MSNEHSLGFGKLDEEEQLDQEALEEKKRKEQEELEWLSWYKDPNNNLDTFNPKKKFGVIQPNNLVYDEITSSYPLNLPTDYYARYILQTVP